MKGIGVSTEAVKCDSFHDEQTCLSGACGMPVVKGVYVLNMGILNTISAV